MFDFLLDLLFPRRCPVCDDIVKPFGALICEECMPKLVFVREPKCLKCGKELKNEEQEFCYDCSNKKHDFEQGIALYSYQCIKTSIYRYKYCNRQEYAVFYAKQLALRFSEELKKWKIEAIVPVPLHPHKLRARGYNQAALIALEFGKIVNIPVDTKILQRCKNTKPQKDLDGIARQNNLKNAFKISKNDVKLNAIVIIDDIYTTGSTIDSISRECKKSGIQKVYFISLAIGSGL